jgi:mannosyl-oligosaccharide glucosidase
MARYGQENVPPPPLVYSLRHERGGGLHVIQKTFKGPFEFDILYNAKSSPEKLTCNCPLPPQSDDLATGITDRTKDLSDAFNTRFTTIFPLKPPFTTPLALNFSKQALSSVLGGISYFHGTYLVDRTTHSSYDEEEEQFWIQADAIRAQSQGSHLEGPRELFTATPSRPFFPRGFYWDEGFHLLPVGEWDNDLALEVLGSWAGLMDSEGWIAREQILGEEARAKVPGEFQTQFPHYANPPTLLMPIAAFIERLRRAEEKGVVDGEMGVGDLAGDGVTRRYLDDPELARHYLRELYPLLQRHHEWFRRTQAGDIRSWDRDAFSSKEGYRWRGRTPDHCLTSGLDDYPRARPPHTGELHVDLLSWMGLFARTLRGVAEFLEEGDDAAELARIEHAILRNLDGTHPPFVRGLTGEIYIGVRRSRFTVIARSTISVRPDRNSVGGAD